MWVGGWVGQADEPCCHLHGEGAGVPDGNISLWEISHFKGVRNFPLNSQACATSTRVEIELFWGVTPPPLVWLGFPFEWRLWQRGI